MSSTHFASDVTAFGYPNPANAATAAETPLWDSLSAGFSHCCKYRLIPIAIKVNLSIENINQVS